MDKVVSKAFAVFRAVFMVGAVLTLVGFALIIAGAISNDNIGPFYLIGVLSFCVGPALMFFPFLYDFLSGHSFAKAGVFDDFF